jgi:diaminopimelate decarboxylase
MGIKLYGIHFHCGSGVNGASTFEKAILKARKCIEIGRYHDHEMKLLDIGGGFPAGEIGETTINSLKIT